LETIAYGVKLKVPSVKKFLYGLREKGKEVAHLFGFADQTSPTRTTDGVDIKIRSTRDGALATVPWIQALCLEGRVHGVQFGDATTDPVGAGEFGAGVIDLDEFDFLQTIPATVAVLPLFYQVALLAVGTAGEAGLTVLWGNTGAKHASGITPIPFNLKTGSSNVSLCTFSALSDDAGTAIVPEGIIYQNITTALTGVAGTAQQFVPPWSAATAGFVPVLEGAAGTGRQIAAFMNGQAATGYFTSFFAELPIAAVS